MTAVFKSTPKFNPPPVGGDPEAAIHWKTKLDLFLRSNRFVRDMLDGRRPHPWIGHAKLQSLGNRRTPGWVFSPSTTTSTLEWVAKQDEDLATELDELLHFGDIVSWGSLNEAIYTTVYSTLKTNQRYLISGVEHHDGITARQQIYDALTDPDSTEQARLFKYATKIRRQEIVPGPDPIGTYFGRIQSYWHDTSPAPGEPPAVPEADVVGTVLAKLTAYHPQMKRTVHYIRRTARDSGRPELLQLSAVQKAMLHAWRTELTEAERKSLTNKSSSTMAAAVIPAGSPNARSMEFVAPEHKAHAKADRYLNYGRGPFGFFLPGGCKNCPKATNHITRGCYITKRQQKLQQSGGSMPSGEQWCAIHTNSWHFNSECRKRKRQSRSQNALVAAVTKQLQQNKQLFRLLATDTDIQGREGTQSDTQPVQRMRIPQLAALVNALSPAERAELGKQLM